MVLPDLSPDYGSAFVCGKSRFESEKFHVKNDKILEISCGDEHTGVVTGRKRVQCLLARTGRLMLVA